MNGQQAIIDEIVHNAEKAADGLIAAASAERDKALEKVRNEEMRKKSDAIAAAQQAADALLSRRQTLDRLDARKTELAAKQQAVDAAFAEATKKVLNMTDHIYRDYMGSLIAECAQDGDCVTVAARDAKRLHAEWLENVRRKCGKHLSLNEETHAGAGGVILCGKTCDINLTLETLIKDLRERLAADVAKRLFK